MDFDTITNSFQCTVDLPVDVKVKTKKWTANCHSTHNSDVYVLINFEYGMCNIGHMTSWDGGMTYNWSCINTCGVRVTDHGVQYFDNQSYNCWKFFDEPVQQAYAQYLIEKELK